MYGVAANVASRMASVPGSPPLARPAIRRAASGVPAYRAASPRGPSRSPAPGSPGLRASLPRPPLTVSSQAPALAGNWGSASVSGTDAVSPAGKPRAAIAAGALITRSIHASVRCSRASGSAVSQPMGSAGPATAWTVPAIDAWEAISDQTARVAAAVQATAKYTVISPGADQP